MFVRVRRKSLSADTDEIKHNPDKQIRPEIYVTLKIVRTLLQKSDLSFYSLLFHLKCRKKRYFLHMLLLFLHNSINPHQCETLKTHLKKKEEMKSFIQLRLQTFETVNEWSLSRDQSKFIKPGSLMHATINKCVETFFNVQRVHHSQQHT